MCRRTFPPNYRLFVLHKTASLKPDAGKMKENKCFNIIFGAHAICILRFPKEQNMAEQNKNVNKEPQIIADHSREKKNESRREQMLKLLI